MARDLAQTRRDVLKGAAVAGAAVVLSPSRAVGSRAPRHRKGRVLIYRLQARNTHTCRACRVHHRFVLATSHALMDANRAHPGCNCPITRQEISFPSFFRLFPDGGGVVDLRQLRRTRRPGGF